VKSTNEFALFAKTGEIYQQKPLFFKITPTNPNKIGQNEANN